MKISLVLSSFLLNSVPVFSDTVSQYVIKALCNFSHKSSLNLLLLKIVFGFLLVLLELYSMKEKERERILALYSQLIFKYLFSLLLLDFLQSFNQLSATFLPIYFCSLI